MKTLSLIGVALALLLPACVQKSSDKTVVYLVDVSGQPGSVQKVGLRGRDKPLSWNEDLPLTPVVKDSLYRAVVTIHTGYRLTEAKFTLNGEFELKDQPNRRIVFGPTDTTVYRARFGRAPQ